MSKKQVWFSLPVDGKSDASEHSSWHDFQPSESSDSSSLIRESLSSQELTQYSLRPSMDNPNSETLSTNDSPDISTSQQESMTSDGQYGNDDANSTSSLHDEVVNSAIMEISGELMLGQYPQHRHHSGGSESSDISDDAGRRPSSGGAIAKYPESSTGLSDNDWNPYATESDTNQTPRSPRSVASDDQNRIGFVSKATFSVAQPKDTTATLTMTTGEVNVRETKPDKDLRSSEDERRNGRVGSERLDVLRYVLDDEEKGADERVRDRIGQMKDMRSFDGDTRQESPETARSEYTEGNASGRNSMQSTESLDTLRRESTESGQSSRSQTLGPASGRPSSEFELEGYGTESAEFVRSFRSEDAGSRPGRQSVESSGRSPRSDLDKSGESGLSGRQSVESQQSGHSGGSQKSTGRTGSDRSERLDQLSSSAGENLRELMQFESAQRAPADTDKNKTSELQIKSQKETPGEPVSRMRLTARLEPYSSPVRSTKSPERSSNAGSSGYVSVAERERLLADSPKISETRSLEHSREQWRERLDDDTDGARPSRSSPSLPRFGESHPVRSSSDYSMKRVTDLFEETKRQAREAVALRRPDPSGSEERFPLHERLTWPKHDDSFKVHVKSRERLERSVEPEVTRSLNSEEVARVLGKYAEEETRYVRKKTDAAGKDERVDYGSAFDRVSENGLRKIEDATDSVKVGEMSDDDISKRVKALLTETSHLTRGRNKGSDEREVEYVPKTIDYSRLQQDLQEIQDSLQDVPPPTANDSLHVQRRNIREGFNRETDDLTREEAKSLETTGTTTGRESGVSEYGRRLLWDHGADLEYDQGYGGQFFGTMTSTETLSSRLRGTGETDTLVVRPDSAMTNETETDGGELEGTKTLRGSDVARAEKIVEQVMNRRAEGDLKETVEDIIARYRNERQDMFDRLQAPAKPQVGRIDPFDRKILKREDNVKRPILKDPDIVLPDREKKVELPNGKKEPGLAERVYKILTSEQDKDNDLETSDEKGMAKKVYKILASDRPQEQVNGILSETMEKEHEMLKKLVTRSKDDSSLEDSGLNATAESFEEQDVRKQLEYSQFSSPGKGDKSEFTALREVTSAPYSALSNAKSLLSTQLKKMSERNFDKSIELRTPYRQAISCYPVYGMERTRHNEREPEEAREAWMPVRRSAASTRDSTDRALASERFYLTESDQGFKDLEPQKRSRTYSDPFDVSPGRRSAGYGREGHARSRSEEVGTVSDLSQHSFTDTEHSPERIGAQSPARLNPDSMATPKLHRPQEWSFECYTSISDSSDPHRHSDSSEGRMFSSHGYQANEFPLDPEDEHYNPSRTKSPVKNIAKRKIISREPPFGQGQVSSERGRPRTKRGRNDKGQMSVSLPNYYPSTGFVENVPICTNDVYELLSRSQAQEAKLAELQLRLLGKQQLSQDSSAESSLTSDRGQGHIGNHGNRSCDQKTSKSAIKKDLSLRPGYYRGDGSPSPTESDTSSSRRGTKLRPYRPAGSRDMYYTESGDDTNESGTTIESTHPGSDDAAPPYIPSQFLGSRRDEPTRHPTGIYGNREKDDLSTIDENSVKDDKERARTLSGGSGREGTSNDKPSAVTADTGYQTGTIRSRSPAGMRDDHDNRSQGQGRSGLERPGFKTREEFQRDFERRERELKELLAKRQPEPPRDSLGTSTRSDPGGMLEDREQRREYQQPDQMSEFRRLEPEPVYPEERLRYSRSKSDTDLVAISPTESQKYSSPMHPGTRFLEFSTQQSPIFAHHDSITYQSRGVSGGAPPELPKVPADRQREQRNIPPPQELLRVYDRRPVLSAEDLHSPTERRKSPVDLPASTERRKSPVDFPVRPLEPGETKAQLLEKGSRSLGRRTPDEPVRPLEPGSGGQRSAEMLTRPLEPVEPPVRPLEPGSGSRALRSEDIMGPVDLGADPRKLGAMRRTPTEAREPRERTKSPLHVRQKEMEAELEKLNKQLSDQVNEIQNKKEDEHFEDNFPPSKKVQALREVLEQEYDDNLPANINDMWTRFKERKEQSMSESSINSTRLEALSGLLQNPTHHDVHSFIKEKKELTEKQKREEQEKAERLREEQMKMKEEQMKLEEELRNKELEKRIAAEKATLERNLRRQEMKNRRGLSEEESNGSYTEILIENEKKREQRRKKREKGNEQKGKEDRRSKSPTKASKTEKERERRKKTKEEAVVTDIRARNASPKHSDTVDTLFSIPEDASFEQSPSKAESEMKARQKRQRHVIDPLMKKLRDKIKLQRDKIDKERIKELRRVEKLKKLEMLLTAKKKGKLSDRAIGVELEDVSTTSTATVGHSESSRMFSESSGMSDSTLVGSTTATADSGSSAVDSMAVQDGIRLQVKKYPDEKYRSPKKHYVETDSTESSDFSNIIVEKLPESKPVGKTKEKRSVSAKKYRVDEYGNKIAKDKKDRKNRKVFGIEVTEKDLANQLKRYETYMTPEQERLLRVQNYLSPQGGRKVRDAATMYPSPITVSPPSKRRTREVIMKSEAIQTSPSIRSSSPTHAYDEVPVAPVPYMSRKSRSSKTVRCRPSPSPTRSAQTSFSASPPRKTSKSPSRHRTSRSPTTRKSSRSPELSKRKFSPPITRRQAQSPIWKPESEIATPPENSMFTPEGDENKEPSSQEKKEAQSWFIPLKPSKPWQQPLKERQAFAVRQEAWQPSSVSQSAWKDILHGDILKDRDNPNDVSRDTKFDLDPEGHPIGDESLSDSEDDLDISRSKPLSKMSLQEAFMAKKGNIISRVRERQKRLNLAAEQRKMEAYLKMERDMLFQEEKKKEANPEAHPYSDHLHKPAKRVICKEEMREMTEKRYKKLPEVVEQKKLKKRQDEYALNRIKARLFNRKIQKTVLVKAKKWGS